MASPLIAQNSDQDTWSSSSVPLDAIEQELEKLWHTAARAIRLRDIAAKASADGQQAEPPRMARARVLNFVAYSGATDTNSSENLLATVDHLSAMHPSRTILIVADETGVDPSLKAMVTARAHKQADGRTVIHEQVRIEALGPVADSLPSIVLPLLVPDLPTYLWWPGDPPVGHAFWRHMVDACDRLILDSSEFKNPFQSLRQFVDFYRTARRHHTLGDLTWTQLAQWRDLLAQFFDNPAYKAYLGHIETATFSFGADLSVTGAKHANPCLALLLAGWLCSRLGWEPIACRAEPDGLVFDTTGWPSGRSLTLNMREVPNNAGGRSSLSGVRLDATSRRKHAVFEIASPPAAPTARVSATISGMAAASRSIGLVESAAHALLARELDAREHDETFEAALAVAGALAGLARGSTGRYGAN